MSMLPSLLQNELHSLENVPYLNDQSLDQLSALRQASKVIKQQTQQLVVAETLARQFETTQPFQGLTMSTLEEMEEMSEQAEQELETTRSKVISNNARILELSTNNAETYESYKRNREETAPHLATAQQKRQKKQQDVLELTNTMASTLHDDQDGSDAKCLHTTDGCKQLLGRQVNSITALKKVIKTTIECGERIQEVIQPLQSAVSELREAANGGSQSSSTENNVMTELNETCAWYNNVNRLICAVSGISVIHRPDAFGDHSLRIQIESSTSTTETSTATLVVHFEPNTTKVLSAELDPSVAPLSDIVASCSNVEDNNVALLRLIRESRVRIAGAAKRKLEFAAIKKKYVIQSNYGGKTKNSIPEAAAWLYVRVTIPGVGIVVEMRCPPDYPQEYTNVRLMQCVGVMGWTKKELINLENVAKKSQAKTVSEILNIIHEEVQKNQLPVDFAKEE